jgi:hypothetical protein
MRGRRWAWLLPLALLCLLLAPGTWWRETAQDLDQGVVLTVKPVDWRQPGDWPSSLRVDGVWVLESSNASFGGYSALLALPGGRLAAYSDRGGVLTFAAPGEASTPPEFRVLTPTREIGFSTDIESATRDPVSGRRWIGIETANVITRLSSDGDPEEGVGPPEMHDWPTNSGAEAMLRLPDGRFIVLGESERRFSLAAGPGLLFAGDPVEGARAISFRFVPPRGSHPTDIAGLPDGRVLILLRQLDFSVPPFRTRLVVADPRQIREGEEWPWAHLAELSPPLPRDNYEGLATVPTSDGGAEIWIISDDNRASLQRTLLIKLHLTPDEPTPEGAPDRSGAP